MQSGSEPEIRPAQVFVDPSPVRAGLVRWIGRVVAFLIVAYLVLLGASLARAPWAPRLSLPGIGPVVAPNTRTPPPQLGSGAVSTPVPAVVSRVSGTNRSGGGPSSPASPGGESPGRGGGATSTTAAPSATSATSLPGNSGHSSTATTRSTPGATAPGHQSTSTTASGGVTTTTRAHGRGKP